MQTQFQETAKEYLKEALESAFSGHAIVLDVLDDAECLTLAPTAQWFVQRFDPETIGTLQTGIVVAAEGNANPLAQEPNALVSSLCAKVANGLSTATSAAVTAQAPVPGTMPEPGGRTLFGLKVRFDGLEAGAVLLSLDQKLLHSEKPQSVANDLSRINNALTNVSPTNLDLLLDVELPVSVSFGRAQLPLKDVVKLTTGSIVELNRTVSEPVDIVVNNCVIARGEVVVVEGNFGVRIKQIMSKQDRLQTLG